MRAVIYLRQSKDSAGTGLAVDRQRADCERLCVERGWSVEDVLTDNDTSASSGKRRPGYERVLDLMEAKAVDVVVAWHVDRLTRRLADLEDLITRCEASHVKVATVTGDVDLSTDQGRLVGRILASVARGEIERKSARQKRATLQAAQLGKPPAPRAFGFVGAEQVPDEAAAMGELYGLVLSGLTINGATCWLNTRGFTTYSGRAWDRASVRHMLLSPRNAGLRIHLGKVVGPGNWPAIISEDVWRAVVSMLTEPGRSPYPTNIRKWLGSGLYRCHCGERIRVNYSRHKVRIYQCFDRAHLARAADPIDELVRTTVAARLRQPDFMAELAHTDGPTLARLRDEATALRGRMDQLAADYAEGLLTGRQLRLATERLEGLLAAAKDGLTQAEAGTRLGRLTIAPDPGEAFLRSEVSIQHVVVNTLARVVLLTGQRGRTPFRPESVVISWKAQGEADEGSDLAASPSVAG